MEAKGWKCYDSAFTILFMATLEKLAEEQPWNLDQVKGSTLYGNQYAIEIDSVNPHLGTLLMKKKDGQWARLDDIYDEYHYKYDNDCVRAPGDCVSVSLSKEDYDNLCVEKKRVDTFVEKLMLEMLEADIPNIDPDSFDDALLTGFPTAMEQDVDVVIAYLRNPENAPFEGEALNDAQWEILEDKLDMMENPNIKIENEKFRQQLRDKLFPKNAGFLSDRVLDRIDSDIERVTDRLKRIEEQTFEQRKLANRYQLHRRLVREELEQAGQLVFDFYKGCPHLERTLRKELLDLAFAKLTPEEQWAHICTLF